MSSTLRDFASAAVQSKRIRFGDLRRLKRDILPARITTQEEAEVLIALDAVVEKADREWRSYLIGTVRDFVVWGLTPVGQVDRAKAEWLVVVLSSGVARKTARTLAREIAREAYQVDEALLIFGAGRRKWQESNRWMGQKRPMPQRARDATRGRSVSPPTRLTLSIPAISFLKRNHADQQHAGRGPSHLIVKGPQLFAQARQVSGRDQPGLTLGLLSVLAPPE